jgi:hypothetical protein
MNNVRIQRPFPGNSMNVLGDMIKDTGYPVMVVRVEITKIEMIAIAFPEVVKVDMAYCFCIALAK